MKCFLFVIYIVSSSMTWAGVTPSKVYLDSSIMTSQIKPSDSIQLKAKVNDGENVLFKFEEIRDGISTLLLDFSNINEVSYTVPINYNNISLKVTVKGDGAEDIVSHSIQFTYQGILSLSKIKFYPLEKIKVTHPGIILGNSYQVILVSTEGNLFSSQGNALSNGVLEFTVPRIISSGQSLLMKCEIKIPNLRVKDRQFVEIYNSSGMSLHKDKINQGELLFFEVLEDISSFASEYLGTIGNSSISIVRVSQNYFAINTSEILPGTYRLDFKINDFQFKGEVEIDSPLVANEPKIYISDIVSEIRSKISNSNVPESVKLSFQEKLDEIVNIDLPNLTQADAQDFANYLLQNQSFLIHTESQNQVKIQQSIDRNITFLDLVCGAGAIVTLYGGNAFHVAMKTPGPITGKLSNLIIAGSTAIAGVGAGLYCVSRIIEEPLRKVKRLDDELNQKDENPFGSGKGKAISLRNFYENINKEDKGNKASIIQSLYSFSKKAFDVIEAVRLKSPITFENPITDIDTVLPTANPPSNDVDVTLYTGIQNIKVLSKTKAKVKFESMEVGANNTLILTFTTDATGNIPISFSYEIVYNLPGVVENHISTIEDLIMPSQECDGAKGKFRENPDGSEGGFVSRDSTVSSTVTLPSSFEACGKSSITGKNIKILADRVDNITVAGENVELRGGPYSNCKISGNNIFLSMQDPGAINCTIMGDNINLTNTSVSGAAITGNNIKSERNVAINANITLTTSCGDQPEYPGTRIWLNFAEINAPITGCLISVLWTYCAPVYNHINAPISGFDIIVQNYTLDTPLIGDHLRAKSGRTVCKKDENIKVIGLNN